MRETTKPLKFSGPKSSRRRCRGNFFEIKFIAEQFASTTAAYEEIQNASLEQRKILGDDFLDRTVLGMNSWDMIMILVFWLNGMENLPKLYSAFLELRVLSSLMLQISDLAILHFSRVFVSIGGPSSD